MAETAGARAATGGARASFGGVPTVTASEARKVDELAVQKGLSVDGMVNRAGFLAGQLLLGGLMERLAKKPAKECSVTILAGTGNKGAAALACGKNLVDAGVDVVVVLARKAKDYTGVAKTHLSALDRAAKKVFVGYNERAFETADLVLDGLIGAGLDGTPKASVSLLIKGANFSLKPCVALDLPSGMDASGGIFSPVCIKAAATFAIGLPKTGIAAATSRPFAGEVHLLDVGIPAAVWKEVLGVAVSDLFHGASSIRLEA